MAFSEQWRTYIFLKESFKGILENSQRRNFSLSRVVHQKATSFVPRQNFSTVFFPWKWEKSNVARPTHSSRKQVPVEKKNYHVNLKEGHASLHDKDNLAFSLKAVSLHCDKPWGLSDNVTKAPSTVERRDKHWDPRNPSEMSDFTLSD